MRERLASLSLGRKISLLGAGSVLAAAAVLVLLAVWQSGQYNRLAQREVDGLIDADLDHITHGVYNLVRTENEAVQEELRNNLNVARTVLANAGGVSLSNETVPWTAVNQFNGATQLIRLPHMTIGGRPLGQNADPAVETLVVDQITQLLGETATIFQRMNEQGDMLRVATNVQDSAGRRAIGTLVPARLDDGAANPVIAAILGGAAFHGRAYVVNDWYVTAYEPLKDDAGALVGMLYVGVKQSKIEAQVREAILQTTVGKTGYVYVIVGKGDLRGHYVISQRGERDGENIWDNRDSDGGYVIQRIVAKAVALRPGQLATERYRWQNPGEPAPRWKIARLAYYEPWDWVIGTSVYEDELQTYRSLLADGRRRMTGVMVAAGLAISLLLGLVGALTARSIAQPIHQMTAAVRTIIDGDLNQTVAASSRDEIGVLAAAFNTMTARLRETMRGLRESEENYRGIVENALEGLYRSSLEGRFLTANAAMARILGYASPADLISSVTDLGRQLYVRPEERDRFLAAMRETGRIEAREVQFRRKDGAIIWISISGRLARDAAGEPEFIEGFLYDVSGRKRAEQQLQQLNVELERRVQERTQQLETANRELEAFSYSVSHDLRAPLRSIDGFSQALLEDYEPRLDREGKDYLHRVRMASQRMARLIDDLLKLSRLSRTEMQRTEVDLAALAHAVAAELRAAQPERPVEFTAPERLVANGDASLLRIALENLLGNAWKFTANHPAAKIEFGEASPEGADGRRVYFVRDDGAGFDPAYAAKLFAPFQRMHSATEFPGTGIGLATVQRIIRRHGGEVWAEAAVEHGATFYFTLPV